MNTPTPTIEEQLDALLHRYMYASKYVKRNDSMNGWMVIEEAAIIRAQARDDLSLLITKARTDELTKLPVTDYESVTDEGDETWFEFISLEDRDKRLKQLKATTQEPTND